MWMSKQGGETVYISAKGKENIEELKEKLYDIVKDIHSAVFLLTISCIRTTTKQNSTGICLNR